eukprot:Gregarina_sp_Poly_1__320@NODE_1078_length_5165_cov_88_419969_g749_i0_p8_GENE_NODE_1078_length_5165_cov_88_419969_g749_i0NODE_1078_length_5165_cov_88_419969_g749_i0_p8_ORF_typecomplete_len100_score20_68_NODE_1078_length_5165_cov_88_419969_g749_i010981397
MLTGNPTQPAPSLATGLETEGPAVNNAQQAFQVADHGALQNKIENLVETVQGASSEESPNVNEKLLQMSQGGSGEHTHSGIGTGVASKFLEDMISPFYK